MIKYCTKCLYPETKPDLWFNEEGVCSACLSYKERDDVDWEVRKHEFLEIVDRYRSKDGSNYDCLIPVSGGKDSTYQVLRALEFGLNPLCVTGTTDSLTDLGRRNIENIKRLGVDYYEVSLNPVVRRKLNKIALTEIGDLSWPEHVSIFTVPVRIAVQNNIRLIIWGENSQNEYGGPAAAADNNALDRSWLEEFGGLLGLRVSDMVGINGIEKKHLIHYTYPSDEELQSSGVTGLFLGHYFPWDGYMNALYAQAHGFETYPFSVEGSLVNYENLDNYQVGIHDYFKFLKYGFGRATDLANNHIRRNRLTRNDGLKIIKMHDCKYPWSYLGRPLQEILAEFDMNIEEFNKVCDSFTNKRLFKKNDDGSLFRDDEGNLIKVNDDNPSKV
jgi:N-acetyl sugar amidotransferase